MHALVEQFSATRQLGMRPPFFFVAHASAMSVAAPNEHQGADRPINEEFTRLLDRSMVTVIEPYPDADSGSSRRYHNREQIGRPCRAGFFNENVLAGGCGRARDRGQAVVCRRDQNDIDVGTPNGALPILADFCTR
jgi:hypothetical protein